MGSVRIQELEEDNKKLHIECLFQGQSLDLKDRELSEFKTDCELLKSKVLNLEGDVLTQREFILTQKAELTFVRQLLLEEKQERKDLTDRIQVFAGIKEREEISVNTQIETKDWQPVSRSRTRTSIKRQLEDRAVELLKKQRKKEDKEINKGELAPGDVLLEEVKH